MGGKSKKTSRRAREEEIEDEGGIEPSARDFVMARLAAARSRAAGLIDGLDAIIALMVDPEDDTNGAERDNIFENVLEDAGELARSIEVAQEVWESDEVDPSEGEPDVDLSDEDDDEEDDE